MINMLNRSSSTYKCKALVFFPAFDESEYCVRNTTGNALYWSIYNNVRYVVARYSKKELDAAKRMWHQNVSPVATKIQQAFSDSRTQNLCDRLKQIVDKTREPLSKFRGMAVLKCARKFVWYQPAYRYFQAAWTNSFAIPITQDSEYSHNCGMIVVF